MTATRQEDKTKLFFRAAIGYAGYSHVKHSILSIPYFKCFHWQFLDSHCHITLFWCDFQVPKCIKKWPKIFRDTVPDPTEGAYSASRAS